MKMGSPRCHMSSRGLVAGYLAWVIAFATASDRTALVELFPKPEGAVFGASQGEGVVAIRVEEGFEPGVVDEVDQGVSSLNSLTSLLCPSRWMRRL